MAKTEENLEPLKALAAACIARLKEEYPLAHCTLDYSQAWQLLVEVQIGRAHV